MTLERIGARVHPEDAPLFSGLADRARDGDADLEFEHRLLMPDHSVKYLHMVAHGTRDPHGKSSTSARSRT